MADFTYNKAKLELLKGTIDLQEAGDDVRLLFLEAATDENKDDLDVQAVLARAGTTELATYTRGALDSQATTQDDTDDEGVFDAADEVFSAVVTQNAIVAYLIFKFVTDDAGSTPLFFIDSATNLPLTPNGSDITVTFNAEGILNLNDV